MDGKILYYTQTSNLDRTNLPIAGPNEASANTYHGATADNLISDDYNVSLFEQVYAPCTFYATIDFNATCRFGSSDCLYNAYIP